MKYIEKIKQSLSEDQFKRIKTIKEGDNTLLVEFAIGENQTPVTYDFSKNYMRVVANEKDIKAEIFLYGYIGQDFWFDEKLDQESITDLAFTRTLRELETKYTTIDVRINSPGGSVFHGDPIITAMRNSKAEIHTYIDGMAASMAFDIWLAGDVRHMSINSKAMCHATSTIQIGTAQDMREAADRLDKFDDVAVATFAHVTGMEETEIRAQFYDDYKDHWLTAMEIKELGLIEDIEDYKVDNVEQKTTKELIKEVTKVEVVKEELTMDEMIEKVRDYYLSKVESIANEIEASDDNPEDAPEATPGLSLHTAERILGLHA